MRRSNLGPLDVLGISLGTIVILIVLAGLAFAIRTGMRIGASPWWESIGTGWSLNPSDWLRKEDRQEVPGPIDRIELRDVSGAISFTASDASDVVLETVRTAPTQRLMDALKIQVDRRGNTLVIEEKHDRPPFGWAGSATFAVSVPRSVREIDAKSVSGSITVRGLAAGVRQTLETVSGRIETDRSGDLAASTVSGSVSFTFEGRALKVHAISGSIHGVIDRLEKGGSAELSSVSGSIDIAAWQGFDAELSLRSLSGSVSCDFPVSVASQRGNQLRGTVGTGAATLDANTTSGSIRISRL